MKKLLWLLAIVSLQLKGQTIEMEFPAFAGKTYDFIIFQGDKQIKAQQDTIPADGVFQLNIPKEYMPYKGMCRWLITNTAEGGGLDMAIPGHGFKVSCQSSQPNNQNIKYLGFDAVNELNRLHSQQQQIIDKFETMSKASKLYDKKHPLYNAFLKEMANQKLEYAQFHQSLKKNPNYNAKFLPIVNLVSGIAPKLTDDYQERARFVNQYITNELNYDDLFTSGHWTGIIQSWVQMQVQLIDNKETFSNDFDNISKRISDPKKYTDFVGKVTYFLTKFSKDSFIETIAPKVVSSGKITEYLGTLSVYQKAMIGMKAPDLYITEHLGKLEEHNHQRSVLQSSDFVTLGMEKTLLIFYESGCGPCEALMQQLPGKYEILKKKGIDIIAIAADMGEQQFKNSSKDYPWKRTLCDFEGKQGVNFKNYAVMGTPTMFLVDKNGKIESKIASLSELD